MSMNRRGFFGAMAAVVAGAVGLLALPVKAVGGGRKERKQKNRLRIAQGSEGEIHGSLSSLRPGDRWEAVYHGHCTRCYKIYRG